MQRTRPSVIPFSLLPALVLALVGSEAAADDLVSEGNAFLPGVAAEPQLRGGPITASERLFWSLRPIVDPQPPRIDDAGIVSEIDCFVMQKLRAAHIDPRPPATRRVLLRRATFDLTGLPPTPDELQAFLEDDSPDAFTDVVDRLLAAPAYGERWGRHWLDVVRYADTAGETADYPAPLGYKYRNWVIDAFHTDMPYDAFVRQQVAGDILADQMLKPAHEPSADADLSDERLAQIRALRTATGFIAISRRFGFDAENYHHLTIQDTIDVVGQAMLGLTLGCARCHDHKYDPVNMADYYAWYGIFASTRYSFPGSEQKSRPYDLISVLPTELAVQTKSEFDARLASLNAELARVEQAENDATERLNAATASDERAGNSSEPDQADPPTTAELREAVKRLAKERAECAAQRDALQQDGPYELLYGAIEQDAPADSRIQRRGKKIDLGEEVPRRNLEILGGELLPANAGSGRLQLADWLTRDDNPLLARVMVNRIWQQHFGRGLVGTANDFGARGERPTHPQLLDWLASRFRESGYCVKAMHRLIMQSAAYQRSSTFDAVAAQQDPDARLLWRFNRRRLSSEEIRDAMLFVSGSLDRSMGGRHPFPAEEKWGFTQHNPYYGVYPTHLRSVYLMQQRLKRHPFLGLFDGADTNVSTARRELTTVPTQALFLMNNEFVHAQAAACARRLIALSDHDTQRIDRAYPIAFGRPATADERDMAMTFLTEYRAAAIMAGVPAEESERSAWEAWARTLLTRNEFLFVD